MGDVVALEDPGTIQAAYDYCPTGNEADLSGTTPTAAALANPFRQGAMPYDDDTKDYMGTGGVITEDYSGTGIQAPAIANGDCMAGAGYADGGWAAGSPGIVPAQMPDAGGGGTVSYVPPDTDLNPLDNPNVQQAARKCGQEGFKAGIATAGAGLAAGAIGIVVAGAAPEVIVPAAILATIGAAVGGCIHGAEDAINP